MARKFQIKRGLKANLPTLAQGEFAMTTDSGEEGLHLGTGAENLSVPLMQEGEVNYTSQRPPTADVVGASPVIQAGGSSWDMDQVVQQSGKHANFYRTDSGTKGTPYKKGVSSFTNALIFSYGGYDSGSQGFQVAFANGAKRLYVRRIYSSKAEDWGTVFTSIDPLIPAHAALSSDAQLSDVITAYNNLLTALKDVGLMKKT